MTTVLRSLATVAALEELPALSMGLGFCFLAGGGGGNSAVRGGAFDDSPDSDGGGEHRLAVPSGSAWSASCPGLAWSASYRAITRLAIISTTPLYAAVSALSGRCTEPSEWPFKTARNDSFVRPLSSDRPLQPKGPVLRPLILPSGGGA